MADKPYFEPIEAIDIAIYDALPYVMDDSHSYLEFTGAVLKKTNELVKQANDIADVAANAHSLATGIDGKAQSALDNSVEALDVANGLGKAVELYSGDTAPGYALTLSSASYHLLAIYFSNSNNDSSHMGLALYYTGITLSYLPIYYGPTATYIRVQLNGNVLDFLASGNENVRIKRVFGLLPK